MSQPNIKAVGFDIGGVILSSERPQFLRYCQAAFGVGMDEIQAAITYHQQPLERGEIPLDEFWRRVTKALGVDYDPDVDLELWTEHYIQDTPIATVLLELSDHLRANGIKTGVLSNTHMEHEHLNQGRHIFDHFDKVMLSHEIGAVKPEPKAYLSLCHALGVIPSELVFIDDLSVNVEGANALGIHGIKYLGYADLAKRLREFGLSLPRSS